MKKVVPFALTVVAAALLATQEPRPTIPDNRIGMKLQAGGVKKIISLFRAFFVPLHDYWIINEYI